MATMTSVMIPFLTTTTTTTAAAKHSVPPFSSSSSSSSPFSYIIIGTTTITTKIKHIHRFPLTNCTNRVLSSKLSQEESNSLDSASDVVRKFYDGINLRNLSTVVDLIADDCVYEDLVFPQPFVGRKAILEFFEKFIYTISQDLQFAIDDISGEDTTAVGVTWHLEWKGKPFPFSKGCSFYRLKVVDGRRQIIYGRDIVEPAVKPGDFALVAIRSVTWLLQQFPQLAERF